MDLRIRPSWEVRHITMLGIIRGAAERVSIRDYLDVCELL
jgi:hypothetical protein